MSARVDPNLLPTFLAVFDAGRISRAAEILHLSQPAVTAQIRRLEESLGTALFTRSARGVLPTPAGERLAEHARRIARMLAETATAVSGRQEALEDLDLAASTTVAAHVLPPVLAQFRAAYPTIGFHIEVGNTEDVLEAVRGGRVPCGLVEGHGRAAGLRMEPYVADELLPVVAANAPARMRSIGGAGDIPIIWREPGSGTRAVVERALRRAGVRRRPGPLDMELRGTEAVLGAVAAGLGIGFASRWSIQAHLTAKKVVVVPGLAFIIRRMFHFALPAGALEGTVALFHDFAMRNPPSLG